MRNFIMIITLAAATLVSSAVFAQEEPGAASEETEAAAAEAPPAEEPAPQENQPTEPAPAAETAESQTAATPEPEEEGGPFGPLDIDILVHGGLGAFLYPHIEPYVDVGVVPLGKDLTLSFGGGVDLGWCALCGLLSLASGLDISSSYVAPSGRVNLHLGTLGGLIPRETDNFTIDLHVGAIAGPAVYRFSVKNADGPDAVSANEVSFLAGPTVGVRLGFANNRLLFVGEYRFTAETGFSTVTVTDSNGASQTITADNFSRGGSDFVLGVGFRI